MYCHQRFLVCAFAIVALSSSKASEPSINAERNRFFDQEVKPILQAHCWKCHSGEKVKGNLHLTSRAEVLKGGDLGPAVTLEEPAKSRLIKAIHYQDGLEMPPTGKLPDKERKILVKWVTDGLPWPETATTIAKKEEGHKGGVVTEEAKKYWAYQPLQRPAVPTVADKNWVKSPIDAFVLAKLEANGLAPAKPAEPIALVRRVYYDLIGLPPTPEQVDEFVSATSADPQAAYAALIDKLLASPHYGEKWGRHWLDLVRYAETNGYERDGPKPHVWRFRDYVIRSFNDDKPFDRFVKEQLAGDELDRNDPDCVIATGYYRLGLFDDEPADRLQARFDELDDWVATTSQVFLGMTMNCARCHEHKIDPIPHADYYRMLAFFQDVGRYSEDPGPRSQGLSDITPIAKRQAFEAELTARHDRIAQIAKRMAEVEESAIKQMPAEDQRIGRGRKADDFEEGSEFSHRTGACRISKTPTGD